VKTILLINKYTGTPLEIVKSVVPEGFQIRFLPSQTQEALIEAVSDVDYILAGGRLKISKEVLERAEKL